MSSQLPGCTCRAGASTAAPQKVTAELAPVPPRIPFQAGRSSSIAFAQQEITPPSRSFLPTQWKAKRYPTVYRSTVCILPRRPLTAALPLEIPCNTPLYSGLKPILGVPTLPSGRPALTVKDWSWLGLPATPNYTLPFLDEPPPSLPNSSLSPKSTFCPQTR